MCFPERCFNITLIRCDIDSPTGGSVAISTEITITGIIINTLLVYSAIIAHVTLVSPQIPPIIARWRLHYIRDIKLVEGVQRKVTKLFYGMESLRCDCDAGLKSLALIRLDMRRNMSDLIETFKIIII